MTEQEKQALVAFSPDDIKPGYVLGHADAVILRELASIALASLTEPPAPLPAIPDGWKLVPVEPTREMFNATIGTHDNGPRMPLRLYKAMLEAAPAPVDMETDKN